jgi:hypothetical protein
MEECWAWTDPIKKKDRNTGSDQAHLSSLPVADSRSYERENLINSVDRYEKNKYEHFMLVRV